MKYNYAWEKFYSAARHMAISDDPLRDRLRDAFASQLIHLNERDFPPDLWAKFGPLVDQVTRVEARGDEGTIAATFAVMKADEVRNVAETVFDLHDKITSLARDW